MFPYVVVVVALVRVIIALTNDNTKTHSVQPANGNKSQKHDDGIKIKRRSRMKWFSKRKITNTGSLFNEHFIDVKAFYALEFDCVPCVHFVGEINIAEAYKYVVKVFGHDITDTYQHCYYDHAEQKSFFNNTVFVLTGSRMIELGNNYCHVLHSTKNYDWGNKVIAALAKYRVTAEIFTQVKIVGFARQPEMN